MRTSRRLSLAILLAVASTAAFALSPASLVADFGKGHLVLETRGPRCLMLEVYIADTDDRRGRGLMYVESMGEFEGMYFQNAEPVRITMWMKNTPMPLDMIFVREDRRVSSVAADTVPYSTTRIPSIEPVTGVLEVNAGFAKRWSIVPGTRVLSTRFR